MSGATAMAQDLRAHLTLCEELLRVVEREHQQLQSPEPYPAFDFFHRRKQLLPRFDESLIRLKQHRRDWERLPPAQRRHAPEIATLIRAAQNLMLQTAMLDRENEQALLRRGWRVPSATPSASKRPAHFVTALYHRHRPS